MASQPQLNGSQAWVPQLGHNGQDRAQPLTRRPLEELLTALRKGGNLWKHGRQGKPKVHLFHVTENDTRLTWMSKDNRNRSIPLKDVKDLIHGQVTDVFARHPEPARAHLSFSLVYEEERALRTLDLTCETQRDFEYWYFGIQALFEHLQTRPASLPTVPSASSVSRSAAQKAAASAAGRTGPLAPEFSGVTSDQPSPRSVSGAAVPDSPASQSSSSAPGRRASSSAAAGTHIPGDCYVWGSAAAGLESAGGPGMSPWQHSLSPVLVDDSTHLDVRSVAVGRSHAGLLTHGGELYTWGSGGGARLGHGHRGPAATPQRVHTLWSAAATSVKCSDSASAALSQDGSLYTWGDGAAGHLGYGHPSRQYIPRPVGGPLAEHVVAQVSCGPFHMAAVTANGQLFTWGDGFGGRLGHGDTSSASLPRLVTALSSVQVLGVACGAWHTAAVARHPGASDAGPLPMQQHQNGGAGGARCGSLYTWGGSFRGDRDTHRGALGTGDLAGRLLPTRVAGELADVPIRQAAAGTSFTVALTADGSVFQMGETGANGKAAWEGTLTPRRVGGALDMYTVERVSAGSHHVCVLATAIDRRALRQGGTPQSQQTTGRVVLAWGCGSRGQLGSGTATDSVAPRVVEGSLRGRHILQVACGGDHTLAVSQHEVREAEARGAADRRLLGSWSKRREGLVVTVPQQPSRDPFSGQGPGSAAPFGSSLSASTSALSARESGSSHGFGASDRQTPQLPPPSSDAARRGTSKPPTLWPFTRNTAARDAPRAPRGNPSGGSGKRKPRRHTSMDAGPSNIGGGVWKQGPNRRPALSAFGFGASGRRVSEPDGSSGRLSSGDLPRLATAPSAASSTGDSSHHGSVRQDSGISRLGPDGATQDLRRQQQYIDHLEGEVARLQKMLQRQHSGTLGPGFERLHSNGLSESHPAAADAADGGSVQQQGFSSRSGSEPAERPRSMDVPHLQSDRHRPQQQAVSGSLPNGVAAMQPETSGSSRASAAAPAAASILGPGMLPLGFPPVRRLHSRSQSAEGIHIALNDDDDSLPEVPAALLGIEADAEVPAGYVSDGAADAAQRRRRTDSSEFSSPRSWWAATPQASPSRAGPVSATGLQRAPSSAAADQPAAGDTAGGAQMPSVPEASAAQQGPIADAGAAADVSARRARRGNGFHSRTASLFGEEFTVADVSAPQTPTAAGGRTPPAEMPASPLANAQLRLQRRPSQPGEVPVQQPVGQQPIGQPVGQPPADVAVHGPYLPAAAASVPSDAAVPSDAGQSVSASAAKLQPAAGTEATARGEPGGMLAAVRTAQQGTATSTAAQQAASTAVQPVRGPAQEETLMHRSQSGGSPGKRRKSRSHSRLELPPWEP